MSLQIGSAEPSAETGALRTSHSWPSLAAATSAARARSLQLCGRSGKAIDRAGELHAMAWALGAAASRVICEVWDRRDDDW